MNYNNSKKKQNSKEEQKIVSKVIQTIQKSKLKFFNAGFTANVSTTATLGALFSPAQGQTDSSRIGDFARMLKIEMMLVATAGVLANGANFAPQYVRFVLFYWGIDNTDYSPLQADVLAANNPIALPNFDSRRSKKVVIIHDELICINNDWQAVQARTVMKSLGKKVGFNGANTTGTGILHYYLQSNAAGNTPTVTFLSDIHFEDVI